MTRGRRAYVYALLTVFFWSTVATAFKIGLQFFDVFQLIFYACLVSAIVLTTVVVARGEFKNLTPSFRRHWQVSILSGLMNPFAYYLMLIAAYDRLPAQIAQPINYTWAIVLTFLSIVVLKQKMTWRDIVAAIVCYSGVVIIVSQGQWVSLGAANLDGVMLALGSTVVWASYWIVNIRDPREPNLALCVNFLVALPVTFVTCLVFSDPFSVSWQGLAAASYIGVFEMGLAFLFWSYALRLAVNTSRVSNLIFIAPFLSLVFISQILGETIYITTFAGLVVIIAGLLLQQIHSDRALH